MKERVKLGFLEEYYATGPLGDGSGFLGTRVIQETSQGTCSNNAREIILEDDLQIKRSFSKMRTLKKGTRVRIIVYPLEGREID
jgi:hypothetical protein